MRQVPIATVALTFSHLRSAQHWLLLAQPNMCWVMHCRTEGGLAALEMHASGSTDSAAAVAAAPAAGDR